MTIAGITGARAMAPRTMATDETTPEPKPEPTSTPKSGGMSTGAKVGIGIGVATTAAAIGGLLLLRGHRGAPDIPSVPVWIDPTGPSSITGAIDGVNILSNPRLPNDRPATWGTPTTGSIFGPDGDRISIEHVDQGRLGDCWNVAAMGAIAHADPERIDRVLRPASDGRHVILSFPNRTPFAVTDELPLRPNGQPMFAGSDGTDPVYWPAYIEKGQAALLRKGYESMQGGHSHTTFDQLYGTRSRYRSTNADGIVRGTADALARRIPVTISSPTEETPLMQALNIKHNHAYVPKDFAGAADAATSVKLFNPWGDQHPTRDLTADEVRTIFTGIERPDWYG